MMGAPLVLALDVGTSSTRTALFTIRGRRLLETTAHRPYSLTVKEDGTAELDIRVLEREVVRAIRTTLAARRKLRHPGPVIAVGASCFWHSLVGTKNGRPTPVYSWGDSRCRPDADRLRLGRDETAYHARTGCLLRTPYWPAKLRWLRRTGAATGQHRWMSPADWLYGRLCGDFTSSVSMASGTGLLDGRKLRWDPAALRLSRIDARSLPPLSDEPLRADPHGVLPPLHRFPELMDALWFPALGDGACSNLGSDATEPNVAALNFGTSGALRVIRSPRPDRLSTGLFCYRVDGIRSLVGGAISNAGNLRVWALKQLRLLDDVGQIERALAARPMPRGGLTVLPFWTGERAPTWPEATSGTITGLTYSTSALDLLQALTESTYHRLAQIADELSPARDGLDIVVSGGVRHSPEALQRMANVMGRPLRPCSEPEASLRGAAVHVCERLGNSVAPLARGKPVHPARRAAEEYRRARQRQIDLETRMAKA